MLTLWLALAADLGVTYYVMEGGVDVGEVVKLSSGGGYAVRLDGAAGGDILFTVRSLADVLLTARKRLRHEVVTACSLPALPVSPPGLRL